MIVIDSHKNVGSPISICLRVGNWFESRSRRSRHYLSSFPLRVYLESASVKSSVIPQVCCFRPDFSLKSKEQSVSPTTRRMDAATEDDCEKGRGCYNFPWLRTHDLCKKEAFKHILREGRNWFR